MKSTVNGKNIKDELYTNQKKHKFTPSADTLPISDALAFHPSSKLSKLVYGKKNVTKPSIISLASKVRRATNYSLKIKEETVIKTQSSQNHAKITLDTKVGKIKKQPEKIKKGLEIGPGDLKLDKFHSSCSRDADASIVMPDILKNSYLQRGKLAKDSDSYNIPDVGISLSDDTTEWSMSANDSYCHTLLNPVVRSDDNTKKIISSSITSNKISEPIVNRHGNIDTSWDNPVFGISNKSEIPSVLSKDNKLKKCDKVYSSCSFTKDMLKTAKVIGPVDDKFIACLLCVNECDEMLVLVDQHAAHERIRLENLLNKVGFYTNEKKKISGNSTILSPPATFSFTESELSLLVHYKKEFSNVGLNFSIIKSANSIFHRVFVSSVPAIFINGSELQLEAKGSVLNTEFLKEFIHEQIKYMKSTGCPCNMTSRTIFKALASYACHGAIRFGDKISLSTCKSIMKDLAKCDLPFQCAHGRPTIAPIFQLDFLDAILKKSLPKPNLTKIKIE